jgi:hypothetical protein
MEVEMVVVVVVRVELRGSEQHCAIVVLVGTCRHRQFRGVDSVVSAPVVPRWEAQTGSARDLKDAFDGGDLLPLAGRCDRSLREFVRFRRRRVDVFPPPHTLSRSAARLPTWAGINVDHSLISNDACTVPSCCSAAA